MGLFTRLSELPLPLPHGASRGKGRDGAPGALTFTLQGAGYRYEDGSVGLEPLDLTITQRRTAVIGLNGSGKSTLLGLLDGTLTPTRGRVVIADAADSGRAIDTSSTSKRDRAAVDAWVGRVRREEIPASFHRAEDIAAAVDETLRRRGVGETERLARIGSLFAHFDLQSARRAKADELDSRRRHLLAIAAALACSPAALIADEPTKGLDEPATRDVARALFTHETQLVFATHDTDMLLNPDYGVERVLVLDDHRLVHDAAPAEAVACYRSLIAEKLRRRRA